MLQTAPRDVAETLLDDLVDFQIAGPTGSSDDVHSLSSPAAPDTAPAMEMAMAFDLAPDVAAEPEDPPEPAAAEVDAIAQDCDPIETLPAAEGSLIVPERAEPAVEDLAEQSAVSPPVPAAAPSTCGEAMVLRSLLAECGTIVRWLCDKADAGELRSEDIEVARSFLVMAGLPPQNVAKISSAGTAG